MSGVATVEGFRQRNDALVDDRRFQPGMPILFDNTALDTSGLTAADVLAIGKPPVALGERVGSSPIAVVAHDPFVGGDARMAYRYARQPVGNIRIFHSLAEAVVWIRTQQAVR